MIRKYDHPASESKKGSPGRDIATPNSPGDLEDKGYAPQNPTPLDVQDLTPPKGDTAVEPPKRPAQDR